MIRTLGNWLSFVKFSHTIFALPFAIAAMAVAAREDRGWPGWRLFALILGAMVCARTCAMAFNRIVDRRFDALNPRTAGRHLPAGAISLTSAVSLCALSAAAFIGCSWLINSVCFWLSPVALVVICFYSLTKRFTDFTHIYLGVALALAPVGAWLAVRGTDINLARRPCRWDPPRPGGGVLAGRLRSSSTRCRTTSSTARQRLGSLVVRWGPRNALAAAFLAHFVHAPDPGSSSASACRFRLPILGRARPHQPPASCSSISSRAGAALELGQRRLLPTQRPRQHLVFLLVTLGGNRLPLLPAPPRMR
jgi:hypothetical protein